MKKQCCSFLSIIQNFLQIHFYRFIVLPDLVKIRSNPSTICIFVIAYYYPFCKRTFISQIVCLLLWFWLNISGTAADRVIYTPHSGFIQDVILTVKFTPVHIVNSIAPHQIHQMRFNSTTSTAATLIGLHAQSVGISM